MFLIFYNYDAFSIFMFVLDKDKVVFISKGKEQSKLTATDGKL